MEEWPASTPSDGNETAARAKQAACLTCRRSKIRCLRNPGDAKCKRCTQTGVDCLVPDYHVGRQKGVKNKRTGLDKAVHSIEQAIKKSKTHGTISSEDDQTAIHLRRLLSEAQNLLPEFANSSSPVVGVQVQDTSPLTQGSVSSLHQEYIHRGPASAGNSGQSSNEDSFALDDAENPLQLLARASDLPAASGSSNKDHVSPVSVAPRVEVAKDDDLQTFFGPFTQHLDVSPDIDPIEMGFVTMEEADGLFSYFYQHLSHTRWGLDPRIHTASFVRSRSAFLFTSLLAAAALFLPNTAALARRLSVHCRNLADRVMIHRNRSPEIVLAFMVNIPWMSPGKHWADDATCSYMAMALTVAIDLSLNKLIVPSPSKMQNIRGVPKSDCIAARKALELDGFEAVDPASAYGKRLLRRRERIWLALFVLDRGVCLARGRSFTVPVTPLIEACDSWHKDELADTWDSSIISSAVMRRDLAGLIAEVKTSCDTNLDDIFDGSTVAQSLQNMIESFFNRWFATWAYSVEGSRKHHLPPYVEILVSHTRLSTYSLVINHPTAPIEVKRFFRAAGLSSALNVMRAAVQGESQLKSMPNNTAIMISFAACFALCLSCSGGSGGQKAGGDLSLAPSIRILIEETADVLERIGATPAHRRGMGALYGRHLREVVRNTSPPTTDFTSRSPHSQTHSQSYIQSENPRRDSLAPSPQSAGPAASNRNQRQQMNMSGGGMVEPMQFSAMSDYQIVEAINQAGTELETCITGFQIDDRTGLDWLDWFNLDYSA